MAQTPIPTPGGTPAAPAEGATTAGGAATAARPLFCFLLLDKNSGFTLEILDNNGANRQSITLDGLTLTMRVQGAGGISTFTQTAEAIALNAKDVSIDAETIRLTSRAGTSVNSLGTINLSSVADMTLQTPGRLTQSAMSGVDVNTLALAVNAMQNASITAMGGVALFGAAGGVQAYGSSVTLTGINTSVVGVNLGLLAANITIGAPPGGGSGGGP